MNYKQLFRRKDINSAQVQSVSSGLIRKLSLKDLTAFGIAAIIGAGIFSTIGNAAASGGPAVSLLFVFTAITCSLSALCYAEFASRIPISGSAYTYAYVSFGELVAWIIGWDLIVEYAIGNIAVAISWSDYFTSFLDGFRLFIPEYFTTDYISSYRGFHEASALMDNGVPFSTLSHQLQEQYVSWRNAPSFGSIKLIADLPALAIVTLISILVLVGIQETKRASNMMVTLKLIIIGLVIFAGVFYINTDNWVPFAPKGITGILGGISAVFFAYIGFDAISTTAEECVNPQRDLPKAMFLALGICTILYVVISLVLTGMVPYTDLQGKGDPLAYVFEVYDLKFLSGFIAIGAIVAMAGVLLVFQMGQPRIWMNMSRDGLLPPSFAKIHPRFKTPYFATFIAFLLVFIPTFFFNLEEVTDLCSIGTLFAFILVCGGLLVTERDPNARFKVPYINSKYILAISFTGVFIFWPLYNIDQFVAYFIPHLVNGKWHIIPFLLLAIISLVMAVMNFKKNFSLIPLVGMWFNMYMMSQLELANWIRFFAWMAIGLVIYFLYGMNKSKMKT